MYGSLILQLGAFAGKMPEDIKQLSLKCLPDASLTELYAVASNHLGVLMHEADGSDDVWTKYAFYEWWEVEELLLEEIFRRMKEAGMLAEKPRTGYHPAVEPLMEANGYRDGSGWWIKK